MFNIDNALSKLADVTNEFFVCINMEGNYCYINNAFKKRFGFDNKIFIGRNALQDIHENDHQLVIQTVEKCCTNVNTAHDLIVRKPLTANEYIYTKWDFTAIPNENNLPDYILCIGLEITSFIEDGIANHSLLQEIAYDQSHLVRRPLANILGLSKLLAETTPPEKELRELLPALYLEAQDLDNVVKSVTTKALKK